MLRSFIFYYSLCNSLFSPSVSQCVRMFVRMRVCIPACVNSFTFSVFLLLHFLHPLLPHVRERNENPFMFSPLETDIIIHLFFILFSSVHDLSPFSLPCLHFFLHPAQCLLFYFIFPVILFSTLLVVYGIGCLL